MKPAFLLMHMHVLPSGEEDIKIIGIYSSAVAAEAAVEGVASQPGFCDNPRVVDPLRDEEEQGFYIDEYTIDQDHWREGFVTMVGDQEWEGE